jgi:hypothetical protein
MFNRIWTILGIALSILAVVFMLDPHMQHHFGLLAMAAAAAPRMTPAQMNMMARQSLLATGLQFTKRLQSYSSLGNATTLGSTIRVSLDRTGIVTGVTMLFQVPFTSTGATSIVSGTQMTQYFPYNIVQNVTYTDFAGVKHVNTTGWQLHALNALRGGRLQNNAHAMEGYITSETGINANVLGVMNAATGAFVLKTADWPASGLIFFSLYVPLAYDPNADLRGAVLAQTDRGEHYINLTFANALAGTTGDPLTTPIEVAATGATFTLGNTAGAVAPWSTATIVVDTYQHYLMPQAGISPNNLPMIDLGTIYEVVGGLTDSSNIVGGANKFINWPNNRAILSVLTIYDNPANTTSLGNVLNETDMTLLTLLINGNTNVRQLTPALLRMHMRYYLGVDLPSGVYYLSARRQPITTQLYGNVQTQMSIAAATVVSAIGTPYFMNQFESFYLSGTPLPGVIQG